MKARAAAAVIMIATCGALALLSSAQYGCSDDPEPSPTVVSDDASSDTAPPLPPADVTVTLPPSYRARANLQWTMLADAGAPVGVVDLVETSGVVTIAVAISGAKPGLHGMHIHANGSCESNDAGAASAAGGHWNPADGGHGLPPANPHHPGDFGNISIALDGTGTLNLTSTSFSVQPGLPNSALQRAVIFHAAVDDGVTQPTGNSGGRAACGIIEARAD